jgi:hypothetical protein
VRLRTSINFEDDVRAERWRWSRAKERQSDYIKVSPLPKPEQQKPKHKEQTVFPSLPAMTKINTNEHDTKQMPTCTNFA